MNDVYAEKLVKGLERLCRALERIAEAQDGENAVPGVPPNQQEVRW